MMARFHSLRGAMLITALLLPPILAPMALIHAAGRQPAYRERGGWHFLGSGDYGTFWISHQHGSSVSGAFADTFDLGGIIGGVIGARTFSLQAMCGPGCTPDTSFEVNLKGKVSNRGNRLAGILQMCGMMECQGQGWTPFVAHRVRPRQPGSPTSPLTGAREAPVAAAPYVSMRHRSAHFKSNGVLGRH